LVQAEVSFFLGEEATLEAKTRQSIFTRERSSKGLLFTLLFFLLLLLFLLLLKSRQSLKGIENAGVVSDF
jgi:hypothetical protein